MKEMNLGNTPMINEIVSLLKTKQKEYKHGSDAYNVLRSLETLIVNIVKESQEMTPEIKREFEQRMFNIIVTQNPAAAALNCMDVAKEMNYGTKY